MYVHNEGGLKDEDGEEDQEEKAWIHIYNIGVDGQTRQGRNLDQKAKDETEDYQDDSVREGGAV